MSWLRPAVVGLVALAVFCSAGWADAPAVRAAETDPAPTEEPVVASPITEPLVVEPTEEPLTSEPAPIEPVEDLSDVADVPRAPVAASATAGDSSALVRWAPPADDGGAPIQAFVVRAAPSGDIVKVDGDRASARVIGLRNGEAATFSVRAINAAGRGDSSQATAAVTPRAVASFAVEQPPQRRVLYGERTRVRIALVTAAGLGVPNQRVNLLARVGPSSRWRQVDSDTTGSRGRVTLGVTLPGSAALRVRHPIGSVVASDRAVGSVVVAKRVSAAVQRTRTRLGKTVVVRGRVAPRQGVGSHVVLQRRVDGSWRKLAVGRMTTQRRYVVRWNPRRVGTYVVRARKRGGNALAAGVSRPWRHRVKPETAADIAADILRDDGITLTTVHASSGADAATARRNIVDVANGRRARTSCYGTAPCRATTLDLRMLRSVRQMGRRGTLSVSEFAGGSHASGSDHYSGRGLDVNWVNGRHVGYGSAYGMVVDMCRKHGASEIFTPANDPWGGHHNHIHCGWS